MITLSRWKIIVCILATVFGIAFTAPNLLPQKTVDSLPVWLPHKKLNLGLDLQGGSYLLYEVDVDALKAERLTNLLEDVRSTLREKQIVFTGLGQVNGVVTVRITDPAQLQTAYQELNKLGQPLPGSASRDINVSTQSDQRVQLVLSNDAITAEAGKAVDQSIEIIRRRIDELGTKEPAINRQGVDRIVVQAPGESDPERLKNVIGQTAKLTFQMVDDSVSTQEAAAGRIPPGSVLLPYPESPEGVILVKRRALVTGEMLTTANSAFDDRNRPAVSFRFNGQGARKFGDATMQNVGKRFAIVLDNKVISAPVIQTPITGGTGIITGNFTPESANNLSVLLRAGALPAPLKVEEQRTVGAELGADAVKAGSISLAIGAAAIFVFIILAYGLFGVFAAIALLINVFMILGAMSFTQATLTFPGIAGLILTLAVAVDANVLIYERMRDEAHAGRTAMGAADQGYRRALVSIIDANVTTLISALIMFQFGSGPVKGFAWTLFIGVITSVFTAVLITQVLIGWWFRATKPKALPIA